MEPCILHPKPAGQERPFLVTLGVDPESQRRLETLRRRYFPKDRNVVPAHVSLLHWLPPDLAGGLPAQLTALAAGTAPFEVVFGPPRNLGNGVMLTIDCPELTSLQAALAATFAPHLNAQDRQPFHAHVTVMNKAAKPAINSALIELAGAYAPFAGRAESLLLWRYLGGPWEAAGTFALGGHA